MDATVSKWIKELGDDLYGRTLPFWCAYSVDQVNGGFYNCLDGEWAGVAVTCSRSLPLLTRPPPPPLTNAPPSPPPTPPIQRTAA